MSNEELLKMIEKLFDKVSEIEDRLNYDYATIWSVEHLQDQLHEIRECNCNVE